MQSIISLETALSFISGIIVTLTALYRYMKSRISIKDIDEITKSAKEVVAEYENAKRDGIITPEERLAIAEKSIKTLSHIIESLKS